MFKSPLARDECCHEAFGMNVIALSWKKAVKRCVNSHSGCTVAAEGRTAVFVFRDTGGFANATYAGVVIPHESQV
jgi:hypothetical protein